MAPKEPGWWRVYRNRNALAVYEYLSAHPCVDCGEADPVVLEFDHVRGEKVRGIARMMSGTHSVKTIMAEIGKCDVRCANCHRRVTAARGAFLQYLEPGAPTALQAAGRPIRHGTEAGYRRGCRCDDCRAAHTKRVLAARRRKAVA
jgi:hypothetical protein